VSLLAGVGAGALALALGGGGTAQQPPPPAPAPGPSPVVRFAVKGDWGWGGPDQAAVTRRMCGEYRRAPFRFVVTTGDNFYRPDGTATASNFTRPERCLTALGVRWHAAWGNHDVAGNGTADALGSPRRYHAVSAGPMRLLVLDGNDPDDPAQLRFIRRQLAVARQPVRVVAVHQPLHTAGIHPPAETARRLWEPLFRRGRVTLVLQGHNHAYERIRAAGMTYVTTGGGGAPVYPCIRPAVGLQRCVPAYHFLLVAVTRSRVVVRAVTPSGATIERVVLPVRAPATAPADA
jgi:tartrate-resistant acid phosphatase type 5